MKVDYKVRKILSSGGDVSVNTIIPNGAHWTQKHTNKFTTPNMFIDYRVAFCRAASV